MNFNNLTGYEFEELTLNLLKKMGFSAEQTSLSGDEGVDIIAYNDKPIFKGKYLIQCKNWKNKVGQPEVRDLYGVVIGAGANKGILITTSYFTQQAIHFAENKNIELIGYDVLNDLVKEYGIDTNNLNKINIKRFMDYEDFDNEKYTYLKTKIEDNRSDIQHYRNLQYFYHNYITSNKYDIIKNGLLDNYVNLNNEGIKRFCSNKKNKIEKFSIEYRNAFMYLIKGEIYKCVDICRDIGFFNEKGINFLPLMNEKEYFNIYDKNENENDYKSYCNNTDTKLVILKNLFLIFDRFNYKEGINFIRNLFNNNLLEYEERSKSYINIRTEYCIKEEMKIRYIIDKTNELFNNPREIKYSKIHLPIGVYVWTFYDKKEPHNYTVQYKDNVFIPMDDFIEIYYKEIYDKLNSDLKRIGVLFS